MSQPPRVPVRVFQAGESEQETIDCIVQLTRVPCVDEHVVVRGKTWKVYEVVHLPGFWDEPKETTCFAAVVKVMMGRTP